jgi:hypothetical protein
LRFEVPQILQRLVERTFPQIQIETRQRAALDDRFERWLFGILLWFALFLLFGAVLRNAVHRGEDRQVAIARERAFHPQHATEDADRNDCGHTERNNGSTEPTNNFHVEASR